jgi:hypothetical protein
VPPEALAYQSITAPLDDALMVTVPAPQRELLTPVGLATDWPEFMTTTTETGALEQVAEVVTAA